LKEKPQNVTQNITLVWYSIAIIKRGRVPSQNTWFNIQQMLFCKKEEII